MKGKYLDETRLRNMTKRTLLYIGIGCLLAVMACLSYSNARKQMLEVAERAFVEAVRQDLEKREKNSGESISYHYGKEKPEYEQMRIMKDDGTDESYSLKEMDYSQNVDPDFYHRTLHTIMVEMGHGVCPDSLNLIWQKELLEDDIEAKTAIVVGENGDDVASACDSLSRSFTALPMYYAGAVNEIRLSGFVRLIGFDIFHFNPFLLIYICLLIGWIAWVIKKRFIDNQKSFLLVEGIFRLSKDVVYCPDLRCFMKGTEKITLSPKSNLIVKALMEAENHQLHGADLLAKVWDSNESNMNKLYIQNSKLRSVLKALGDGFDVVSVERSHFRLVFPYLYSQP